jgi:hypothetical protein
LFLVSEKGQRPANLNLQEFDSVREAASIFHSDAISSSVGGLFMAEDDEAKKHNFAEGLLVRDLADGAIAVGQAAGEDVLLVRRGNEFFAIGAN